jgi:hypothetical protein
VMGRDTARPTLTSEQVVAIAVLAGFSIFISRSC